MYLEYPVSRMLETMAKTFDEYRDILTINELAVVIDIAVRIDRTCYLAVINMAMEHERRYYN